MYETLLDKQEPKKPILKPFKVNFITQKEPGRSRIQIGKPLNLVPILTPKFYTKSILTQTTINNELIKLKMKQLTTKEPKDMYKYPMTENQRYGWYNKEYVCNNESKANVMFRKSTPQFVKEHLMTYEKIRE